MIQKPDDINYEERFEEYEMDAMERLHVYTDEEIEEMYQEHLMSQGIEEPEEMSVLFEGEASEPQYPICSECGHPHLYAVEN